ncbi:hypothetical protein ACFQV2_05455 [Actinokineospora soli]|uniref:Uncharacterized protein n=1 Tax=Actinokineospora soli TaxID=1048753 RepID=A0ABW2THC8_9PSEU
MSPFELPETPALSRSTLERDDALRKDGARLDALWATSQVLLVDRHGRTPVRIAEPAAVAPGAGAVPPTGPHRPSTQDGRARRRWGWSCAPPPRSPRSGPRTRCCWAPATASRTGRCRSTRP